MTAFDLLILLRGVLELVLWLMIGRRLLLVFVGRQGQVNAVVQIFDLLLTPVRAAAGWLMPGLPQCRRDLLAFVLLLVVWMGLGLGKVMLVAQ